MTSDSLVLMDSSEGWWDIDSEGLLVRVGSDVVHLGEIRVLPPRRRQRTQKGQVKRDYLVRRRKNRKNKYKVKLRRKRYYRRNKRRILRYQKQYRENPHLFKRLEGGGVSTRKQKNDRDDRKKRAMLDLHLDAIRSVMDKRYRVAEELEGDFELEGALARAPRGPMKRMKQKTRALRRRPDNQRRRLLRKVYRKRLRSDARFRKYRKDYAKKYYKKNKSKIRQRRKRGTEMMNKLSVMQALLAILRAAHWSHWTSHWQVKGTASYGDHLLMEKLYAGLVDEIDTLAEKIIGEFGSDALDAVDQAQLMTSNLITQSQGEKSPLKRALHIEENLQKTLKVFYDMLKQHGMLSLGLDDYVMSLANAHETNLYLLRQRHR